MLINAKYATNEPKLSQITVRHATTTYVSDVPNYGHGYATTSFSLSTYDASITILITSRFYEAVAIVNDVNASYDDGYELVASKFVAAVSKINQSKALECIASKYSIEITRW